jgi:diacylglycerol kinase (ATP)
MPICVIFNPVAKGGKARRFQQSLDQFGGRGVLQATCAAGDGRVLAAQAVRDGFTTIVAAGGDGTLNEVINGIGDEPDGFRRTRLGLLPLGTVNVFARELRLPTKLSKAWQIILSGREIPVDIARIESQAQTQTQTRYFVQLAGAGLDARAVELVAWRLKQRFGWFAYILAGAQAMKEPQPTIQLQSALGLTQGQMVLIGNGQYYGGNYRLFPDAHYADGRLDVLVLHRVNWLTAMRCLWGSISGRLHRQPGLEHFQTPSLRLTSSTSVAFQLDGEWAGHLPLSVTVLPRTLRVMVADRGQA